jgi:hypothetical protein
LSKTDVDDITNNKGLKLHIVLERDTIFCGLRLSNGAVLVKVEARTSGKSGIMGIVVKSATEVLVKNIKMLIVGKSDAYCPENYYPSGVDLNTKVFAYQHMATQLFLCIKNSDYHAMTPSPSNGFSFVEKVNPECVQRYRNEWISTVRDAVNCPAKAKPVFWGNYEINKQTGIITGRPWILQDNRISVCLIQYNFSGGCYQTNLRLHFLAGSPSEQVINLEYIDNDARKDYMGNIASWLFKDNTNGAKGVDHLDIYLGEDSKAETLVQRTYTDWDAGWGWEGNINGYQLTDEVVRYNALRVYSCSTIICNYKIIQKQNSITFFQYGNAPQYSVRDLSFIDSDEREGFIGGLVKYTPPKLYEYQEFRIYLSIDPNDKVLVSTQPWRGPKTGVGLIPLGYPLKNLGAYQGNEIKVHVITANEIGENDKDIS